MVKDIYNSLKINSNNNHLIDVFSENSFLELGNINYNVMKKILNYQKVLVNEISYFPIQSMGVFQLKINDEQLKNKLSFLYFENMNHQENNIQLFITYGILEQILKNKKEIFSPILLIPVKIFLDNENIYLQMISRPIENKVLLDKLKADYSFVPQINKLDSYISIDKYVMQFLEINNSKIYLENYLTFANVKTVNLRIPHKKFSIDKSLYEEVDNLNYKNDNNYLNTFTDLNKEQHIAFLNAKCGNSFAIAGRLGTGKTTTLINIAIDQMSQGKKVLYVSNMEETINYVKTVMGSYDYGNYICDLTIPFDMFSKYILNPLRKDNLTNEETIYKVNNDYKKVLKYENYLFSRINDYRFFEILTEQALLANTDKVKLEIDDLSTIYKHEYEIIYRSICQLQSLLYSFQNLKVLCISDSIYSEIPITIEYDSINKTSILKIIQNIRNDFVQLKYFKTKLENEFGLNCINNFGKLRINSNYLKSIDLDIIPNNWFDHDPKIFKKAFRKFKYLQEELHNYQMLEDDFKNTYDLSVKIDINKEIENVLSNIYNIQDAEKIDEINAKREEITKYITKGAIERETFLKSLSKIKKYLSSDFNDSINTINELVLFAKYSLTNKYNRTWLDYLDERKRETALQKIDQCVYYLNKYNELLSDFNFYFPKNELNDLNFIVDSLQKIEKDPNLIKKKEYSIFKSIKKKYRINNFNDLLEEMNSLINLNKDIASYKEKYKALVGKEYYQDENDKFNIIKFVTFIGSINNKDLKKVLVDYIKKRNRNGYIIDANDNHNATFNLFIKSYNNLLSIHEYISNYYPVKRITSKNDLLEDIINCFTYFKNVFNSNDKLKIVIKNYNFQYVKFEDYLNMSTKLEHLKNFQKHLDQNEEYIYIYSKLYNGTKTNTNQLASVIDFYKNYSEIFVSQEDIINSIKIDRRPQLLDLINKIDLLSEQLGDLITRYNKIFKRASNISYYNSTFNEVLDYLELLLVNSDQLDLYLKTISHLQVLLKYKLNKLVGFLLVNKNIFNLENNFKYTYFETLYDNYNRVNELSNDDMMILKNLANLVKDSQELYATNREIVGYKLRKISSNKASTRFNDFDEYVSKASVIKKLFLSNTLFLNSYLNIENFDIVLIDDCQVGKADEYTIALNGKQVICAGMYEKQTLFSLDLISRMRSSNIIEFVYRYIPTPKQLTDYMQTQQCIIRPVFSENYGVELLTTSLTDNIVNLILINNNYKFSIFVRSQSFVKEIYENISNKLLLNGFSNIQIMHLFICNINISDLYNQYLIDSDYNYLVVQDYIDNKYDNIALNMFDYIVQTRRKLIIYDNRNLLKKENSQFIRKITEIFNSKSEIFEKEISSDLIERIKLYLNQHEINTFEHYNELPIILEYKEKLFGFSVLWDEQVSAYKTVDYYRKVYEVNRKMGFKVFNVLLSDLSQCFNETLNRIIGEIKDE